MKSLALYIDKWYIVGAVCIDGNTRPVNLPNHEDRIWLYFYEDTANDEISYGKGFQKQFRNNENHYYGDVFSLITSPSAKYTMFKRLQPMRGIFKSARIFDDLRKDVDEEGDIETYLSFSQDVSYGARLVFTQEMEAAHFKIKEQDARLSHLALEYTAKKNNFLEDGIYVVLNACNENLHYSIYQRTDNLFIRSGEDKLPGMGSDIRSRALVEYIVDDINGRERLLQTEAEREAEYLRMAQYTDEWLIKMNAAKSIIPVQITGIKFSRDSYKEYSVPVKRIKIDERTEKIVQDIINVITSFVQGVGISHEQVQGILFLGNTFGNAQFRKELCNRYSLSQNNIVSYLDGELSSLVSSYLFMDCEQLKPLRSINMANGKAELQRIENAEKEAEEKKKAAEEAMAKAEEEQAQSENARKFKEAMDNGYEAEKKLDYDNMEAYFGIALKHFPTNEEAKQKYDESLRKKAEQTVARDKYKSAIKLAKSALEAKDWETAKQKAEEAHGYMPESKDALRIKEECVRLINSKQDFDRYIDRADLFIAKKAYTEAKEELKKAQLLDVDSGAIKERFERISQEQASTKAVITELSENLNIAINEKRYDEAIDICNKLVETDFENSRKWSAKIADIKGLQERLKADEARWNSFVAEIESAHIQEQWERLVSLCEESLKIRDDHSVRLKLDKAKEKVEEIRSLKELDETMQRIKDEILALNFSEAKKQLLTIELKSLDTTYKEKIKGLRRLIFQKEEEAEAAKREKTRNQSSSGWVDFEFQAQNQPDKSFFDTPSPQKTESSRTKERQQTDKVQDDFFDDSTLSSRNTSKNRKSSKSQITTNEDFDF